MNTKTYKNLLGIISIIGLIMLFTVTIIFNFLPTNDIKNKKTNDVSASYSKTLKTVSADETAKVAQLPKNDSNNLYIISNVLDAPIKLELNYVAKSVPIKEANGEIVVKDYNGKYLHLFLYRSNYLQLTNDNQLFIADGASKNKIKASSEAKKSIIEIVTGATATGEKVLGIENVGSFKRLPKADSYILNLDEISRYDLTRLNKNFVGQIAKGYKSAIGAELEDWHNDFEPTGVNGVDATNGVIEGFNNYNDTASFRINGNNAETNYIYLEFEKPVYAVTFNYINGGGEQTFKNVNIEAGNLFTEEMLPIMDFGLLGATFKYWDRNIVGTKITANIIINAVYDFEKYNVNFKNIDGKILSVQKYSQFEKIGVYALPDYETTENKKKYTHKFKGWTLSKETNLLVDFETYKPFQDIELYPVFEKFELGENGEILTKEEGKKDMSFIDSFKDFWNVKLPSLPFAIGNWFVKPLLIIVTTVLSIILLPTIIKLLIIIINAIVQLFKSISFAIKSHKKN